MSSYQSRGGPRGSIQSLGPVLWNLSSRVSAPNVASRYFPGLRKILWCSRPTGVRGKSNLLCKKVNCLIFVDSLFYWILGCAPYECKNRTGLSSVALPPPKLLSFVVMCCVCHVLCDRWVIVVWMYCDEYFVRRRCWMVSGGGMMRPSNLGGEVG